jgi:PEP-CTERM motif
VKGNVFRLAADSVTDPANIGAARVGIGTLSGNLSVTNTAASDGFSEKLNAAITAITPQVTGSNGQITGLMPGQTNNTGLTVTLDSSSAGAKTGTATVQFKSDGTGIDNGAPVDNGSQTVTVTGKVYAPAVANVLTTSISFGIVHVGDPTQTKSVTVQNGATAAELNDLLTGTINAGPTPPFSGGGDLGPGLGPQASSSALQVNLSTGTAGIFTDTANLALASHDADLALTTSPLSLRAQVNRFAALGFLKQGGDGTLSDSFVPDFGNVVQGSGTLEALLAMFNDNPLAAQAFTDLLSSNATIEFGSGFDLSGCSVTRLPVGASQPCDIFFDTSTAGDFSEVLKFDVESINADFDGLRDPVFLTLEAHVGPVTATPEPGTMTLLGSGLGMLFFIVRRRRRMG